MDLSIVLGYVLIVAYRYTFAQFRGNGKKMVLDLPRWHGQKIVKNMVFKWSQAGRATIWDHLNTISLRVFRKWRSGAAAEGRRPHFGRAAGGRPLHFLKTPRKIVFKWFQIVARPF